MVGDGFNTAGQVQVVRPVAGKTTAVAGSEGVEEEGAAVAFIVAIIICLEAMGPIALALAVLNAVSVIDLGLDLNAPLSGGQLAVAWMYVEAAFYVASHAVAARATVSSWNGGLAPFSGTAKWSQQRRRVFWRRLLATQPPSEFVASWMYTEPVVPAAAELLLGWLRVPGGLSPAAATAAADRSYQGVPWSRLRAGDVYSWAARQLFAKRSCAQLTPAEDAELRELVAELEQAAGSQLKRDGPEPQLQLAAAAAAYTHTPTPGVRSMCSQMDALRWRARPLVYYALSDAVVRLAYTYPVMADLGYERRREHELPYFYRPPSTSTEAQPRDGAPREALVSK